MFPTYLKVLAFYGTDSKTVKLSVTGLEETS
jgi:hypothetical protein